MKKYMKYALGALALMTLTACGGGGGGGSGDGDGSGSGEGGEGEGGDENEGETDVTYKTIAEVLAAGAGEAATKGTVLLTQKLAQSLKGRLHHG